MEIKRQRALDPEKLKKKKSRLAPTTQKTPQATTNVEQVTVSKGKIFSSQRMLALLPLLLVLLVLPKPTLLTYEKLNIVSKSIYWGGLFGVGEQMFDSHLAPHYDTDQHILYLCHQSEQEQTCNEYQVIDDAGPIAALQHWLARTFL